MNAIAHARAVRLAEAIATQHARISGSWLWLDAHAERAIARGDLPGTVMAWCAELRRDRAARIRTARQQRRRTR